MMVNNRPSCILGLTRGCWGRGNSLHSVNATLKAQGIRVNMRNVIYFLVVGDSDATVNIYGGIAHNKTSKWSLL